MPTSGHCDPYSCFERQADVGFVHGGVESPD